MEMLKNYAEFTSYSIIAYHRIGSVKQVLSVNFEFTGLAERKLIS